MNINMLAFCGFCLLGSAVPSSHRPLFCSHSIFLSKTDFSPLFLCIISSGVLQGVGEQGSVSYLASRHSNLYVVALTSQWKLPQADLGVFPTLSIEVLS